MVISSLIAIYQKSIFSCLNPFTNMPSYLNIGKVPVMPLHHISTPFLNFSDPPLWGR